MRRIICVVSAVAAMIVCGASSASADPMGGNGGSSDSGGYSATAVRLSGDAAPAGGSGISVRVPATCWWAPKHLTMLDGSAVDATNADELKAWYSETMPLMNGSFSFARAAYGDWMKFVDRVKAGENITPYEPKCRESAPECALNGLATNAIPPGRYGGVCGLPVAMSFFAAGAPPAPLVAPADLAEVAHDAMDIADPQVDHNPRITALTNATLVGLPTWFWVTNPASLGGTTGTRTIRAEVGAVWAEVVARTDGLHLSSPAGGASCGPDMALMKYNKGVDESTACTVSFTAASVGYPDGYPVEASTDWTAAWTGSGGTGGGLAALRRGGPVMVPVAESQTVVTDAH